MMDPLRCTWQRALLINVSHRLMYVHKSIKRFSVSGSAFFLSPFLSGNTISQLMHLAAGDKTDFRDLGYGNAFDHGTDGLSMHFAKSKPA